MDLAALHSAHVSEIAAKTARALAANGFDAIAFHSGLPVKRSMFDDQYFPLRAVPGFHHWAPLQQADCAVVFEPGKKPVLARNTKFDFWEAPPEIESDFFLGAFDVRDLGDVREVRDLLPAGKRVAFVGEDASRAALWNIEAVNPPALMRALDAIRTTKTAYEVECLARANERGARGHAALAEAFRSGDASELDLHLLFLRVTAQDDQETPYKNIVALNEHAATLHHVAYAKHPSGARAQSLLVDAAASFAGYGSDITRTWVKGDGATAAAFAHLVAEVEAMQQRLCAAVAIGMHYESLHDESHRQVARILREVKIASASEDELVARGVTRAFFPHGLGHSLGIQTHDVGCGLTKPKEENPFLRNTSIIAKDQSFTIEPGVYFIEPLLAPVRATEIGRSIDWTLVSQLAPFGGVRIEDDVIVTGDRSIRNLTREHSPKGGGR